MKTIALFLLAIMIVSPLSASAETIHLNDGSTLSGSIKSVKDTELILNTLNGDVTIPNTNIKKVEFSAVKELPPAAVNIKPEHSNKNNDREFFQTPTPWFIMSGLQLGAALWLKSVNDDTDKQNEQYRNNSYYTPVESNRTLEYVGYGLVAVWAIVGISKIQPSSTTNVGLSTNGNTNIIRMNHRF